MFRAVKAERTGWRDMGFLMRHRRWGFDCPATDVDFLEYDKEVPVALIEYKREREIQPKLLFPQDSNVRALINLADRAYLPCFGVYYTPAYDRYSVFALNDLAQILAPLEQVMCEADYVAWLYELRQREMPEQVALYLHRI